MWWVELFLTKVSLYEGDLSELNTVYVRSNLIIYCLFSIVSYLFFIVYFLLSEFGVA